MMTKQCAKCGVIKDLSEFHKRSGVKDGLQSLCKVCNKEYAKRWHEENREHQKEYHKKWREENREHKKEQDKKWYEENREHKKEQVKKWRENNPEYYKEYGKRWRENNPEYHKKWYEENREHRNDYKKIRRENNINYKLECNLRSRISNAIKNNQKSGSAIEDLDCSVDDLKLWLENQFQPGMTWDNWGIDGWHIDHIVPLSAFDLTDREQFLKACHYTNLQPLWAEDNWSKGAKIYGEETDD